MSKEGTEIRRIFEFELKRKLSMRAKSSTHEMILLINAFRFYDTNNLGTVTKDQWCKALVNIGLNGFSDNDLSFLFDVYDINSAGRLNYKNFTNFLYEQSNLEDISPSAEPISDVPPTNLPPTNYQQEIPPTSSNNNIPNQSAESRRTCPTPSKNDFKKYFKAILDYIRSCVNDKNGITYYTLALKLKSNEDQIRRVINFESLQKSFTEAKINIDGQSLYEFFLLMDVSDEGYISTYELLRLIRGGINENRKMLIIEKFAKIDKDRKGFCEVELLKRNFNPLNHPDVISGTKTPDEVFGEFCFMLNIYIDKIKGGNSQYISFEEFIEFYHAISAGCPNEAYFIDLINNSWAEEILTNNNNDVKQNNPNNPPMKVAEDNSQSMIINNEPPQMGDMFTRRKTPMNNQQQRRTPMNMSNPQLDMQQQPRRTPINNPQMQQQPRRTPMNMISPQLDMQQPRRTPMNSNQQMEIPSQRRTPMNSNNLQQQPRRTPMNVNNQTQNQGGMMIRSPNQQKIGRYAYRNQVSYNPINNTYILPEQTEIPPQQQEQTSPPNNQQQPFNEGENKTQLGLPPSLEQVLQKVRYTIQSRGSAGLTSFLRLFKLVDKQNRRNLSFDELEKVLNLYRFNLTYEEVNTLFSSFDRNKLNLTNYDEMLQAILGQMNAIRETAVKSLFCKLSRGNTFVNSEELQGYFNSSLHPDVVSKRKTEQQILNEWVYNFEAFAEFYQTGVKNWKISLEEFVNFFNIMGFTIGDDITFENMLNNCWERVNSVNISGNQGNNNNQSNSRMGRAGAYIMGSNNF